VSTVEVRVPDIGDSKDVTVVEVLVAPGAQVRIDDALITLESEKASMDIPSTAAGKVISIGVKKGMKVSRPRPAPQTRRPTMLRRRRLHRRPHLPPRRRVGPKRRLPRELKERPVMHRPLPTAPAISSSSARDRGATPRPSAPPIWDSRSRSSSAGRFSAACA